MIRATTQLKSVNPLITSLQQRMDNRLKPAEWLVISDNRTSKVRSLTDALNDEMAALLQIQQSDWDLDNEHISEAVQWAINNTEIKHLLLAGHPDSKPASTNGCRTDTPDDLATKLSGTSTYDRLLGGTHRTFEELTISKEHFASKINQLCEVEDVANELNDGRLAVHALFYVPLGGVFLLFDRTSNTFRPIGKTL